MDEDNDIMDEDNDIMDEDNDFKWYCYISIGWVISVCLFIIPWVYGWYKIFF